MGFTDKQSREEIEKIVKSEIGEYAILHPWELLANSIGIWYYGLNDHPHVDKLISYINELLREEK